MVSGRYIFVHIYTPDFPKLRDLRHSFWRRLWAWEHAPLCRAALEQELRDGVR
jgi:hypothetical protein